MHFYDIRTENEEKLNERRGSKRQRPYQVHKKHENDIVPGRLLSTIPAQQQRRRRIPSTQHIPRHEPIDYIALRRNEMSKRAVLRTRDVTHEILVPSQVIVPKQTIAPTLRERIEALEAGFRQIAQPRHVEWKPEKDVSTAQHIAEIEGGIAKYQSEQKMIQAAYRAQETKVQNALTDVRNSVSLLYTFTPTYKIWSRFKLKSGFENWQRYITWHRIEEERLFQLTHYAVRIQRVYRIRHGRLTGFLVRAELRMAQWTSAIRIQSWIRGVHARFESQRRRESQVAVRLQKFWRGRVGRLYVKNRLKSILLDKLRLVSPTGSLYRLKDVALYDDDMRITLEKMLALVEDVGVSLIDAWPLDSPPPIPSRRELSIRNWYDAIAELDALVIARQVEITQVKHHFTMQRALRIAAARSRDERNKAEALAAVCERLQIAHELIAMYREECDIREHMRMQRASKMDEKHRESLKQRRAEDEGCMAMHREEMEMRHVVAELRWREADRLHLQGEIDKVESYRLEQEEATAERMREWVATMLEMQTKWVEKQVELKRLKAEEWKLKTREEYVGLFERMEARKIEKEQQKAARKAAKRQRQQEQQERAAALERSRHIRHVELESQWNERSMMELEERHMMSHLSDLKKGEEAKLWDAFRIESKKARPDPLALAPDIVEARQETERERQNQLGMAMEEARMRQYIQEHSKAEYLRQSKEKKRRLILERKAEVKANATMEAEEQWERTRLKKAADKAIYEETLKKMQAIDEAFRMKQAEKLFEARCRKLMHDEEMRLHRLYTEVLHRERHRERKERHHMHNDEVYMRHVLQERERLRLKRMEKTHRIEMAVEDVRSHQSHELENEGRKIGLAIWSSLEMKALSADVVHFPHILRCNIIILAQYFGLKGDPPWKNINWSQQDSAIQVKTELTRAQDLWRRVRNKYLKRTVAANEARRGAQELQDGKFTQAQISLRMAFRDGYKGAQLLRNIAKCYVKLYEAQLDDNDLRMGYIWYLKACERLELQSSPAFLHELAQALYLSCRYQHAAEILARIIYNFPSYSKIPMVVFRAATLMWHLGLFEQSTDYLLHLLENPPVPWNDLDLMFFIARLYLLDENKAHATFAYDDAFRRYRLHGFNSQYPSWKSWVADAGVWRHFGEKALAEGEYLVAKDMYQQVIKRRHEEKLQHRNEERNLDWFHLSQCQVMLHEYVAAGQTVTHWLESTNYIVKVLERCRNWSPETLKRINVVSAVQWETASPVVGRPPKALPAPKLKMKRKPKPKTRKKLIRQQKRQIRYMATAELRQWVEMDDVNTGKIFYFNEKTFEVSWTPPQ